MSDPATSGEPTTASAATAGAAPSAASPGNSAPIGSFGTAKGSGLLRGKRATPPAASSASSAPSGYKPSALEVIRPQSEYKNPFTGETSVAAPVINEPSSAKAAEGRPIPSPAPVVAAAEEPARVQPAALPSVASAQEGAPALEGELFPFTLSATTDSKPAAPAAKAELKILPTEEVKRPAVSWGEHAHGQSGDPRGRRDERPAFRPDRREPRPFEPREPRSQSPRDSERHEGPATAATTEPQKKSGGFFAWLKGLFGGSSAAPEVRTGDRPDQGSDGQHRHNRRRHRGGRGRGGYQGDNRGPRDGQPYQPRDPRDEEGPSAQGGEQRFEGGGRHRRRGGRNRHRDDRGGPRPEGQQGGGAI